MKYLMGLTLIVLLLVVGALIYSITSTGVKTIQDIKPELYSLKVEDINSVTIIFQSGARETKFQDEDLVSEIYDVVADVVVVSSKRHKVLTGTSAYGISITTKNNKVIKLTVQGNHIIQNNKLLKTNKNLSYLVTKIFLESDKRNGSTMK